MPTSTRANKGTTITTKEKNTMRINVTLEAVTHTHTQTNKQDNLINKRIKHKDMMYLCNFDVFKII